VFWRNDISEKSGGSMKKKIVVFNGVHGAGKSTLAAALASQDERLVFYPEVGRKVREEVTYNALESGEAFDREVMKREMARDLLLMRSAHVPLVETWHMGNIGYVYARTPHLVDEFTEKLRQQLTYFEPVCIFIHIDWDVFRQRITEKIQPHQVEELIAFYQVIRNATFKLYDELGLPYHIIENQGSMAEGMVKVKECLAEHLD